MYLADPIDRRMDDALFREVPEDEEEDEDEIKDDEEEDDEGEEGDDEEEGEGYSEMMTTVSEKLPLDFRQISFLAYGTR